MKPSIHADPNANVLPSDEVYDLARKIAAAVKTELHSAQRHYHLMPYRVDGGQILALDLEDERGNSYSVHFLPGEPPAFDQVEIGTRAVDVGAVDMVDALLFAQMIVAAVAAPLPANGNLGAAIGRHWPPISAALPGGYVEFVQTPPAHENPEGTSWPVGFVWRHKPSRMVAAKEIEGDPDALFASMVESPSNSEFTATLYSEMDHPLSTKRVSSADVAAVFGNA
jgi:hypothetical protein